ncbi:MAG: hypothetical protein ACOH1N_10280 [Lutibacter sp.]
MASAHSPAFSRKSFISVNTLHYKDLGHNFKVSDFHFTCPHIPEKAGKRSNYIPIYIFKFKSALNPTSQE